jgi:2-phosphoglycerate kinase
MAKTQLTEEDIEVISNLLAQREKEFMKITDKRLDEYYEYYRQTRKIATSMMMFAGGIFIMSTILAYIGLDILLALG